MKTFGKCSLFLLISLLFVGCPYSGHVLHENKIKIPDTFLGVWKVQGGDSIYEFKRVDDYTVLFHNLGDSTPVGALTFHGYDGHTFLGIKSFSDSGYMNWSSYISELSPAGFVIKYYGINGLSQKDLETLPDKKKALIVHRSLSVNEFTVSNHEYDVWAFVKLYSLVN